MENHDAVSPRRPRKGPGYRGVAAHSAGHRHIGGCNKREPVFTFSLRTVNRCEIKYDNRITSWTCFVSTGHDHRFHVGHDPTVGVLLVFLRVPVQKQHHSHHGGLHQHLAVRVRHR